MMLSHNMDHRWYADKRVSVQAAPHAVRAWMISWEGDGVMSPWVQFRLVCTFDTFVEFLMSPALRSL